MLTQDEFDPLLSRPYIHPLDQPYPPLDERVRIVLNCVPCLIDRGVPGPDTAREIADALVAMDIDLSEFAHEMNVDDPILTPPPTPTDSASQVSFEPAYTYQYENKGDIATIELAAQTETTQRDPLIGWRVRADAGVVAGTHGEFVPQNKEEAIGKLNVEAGIEFGDDIECPIIAGARFPYLPVPAEIARNLRADRYSLSLPSDKDGRLATDREMFPDKIGNEQATGSIVEPFGWDPDRLLMWYDTQDSDYLDGLQTGAYQYETGTLIRRTRIWDLRDTELPRTRQALIEQDDLEPVFR